MNLADFLASNENKKELSSFSNVKIVMGNESCDLDSAVSSIAYAYLLNFLNKDVNNDAVIPLLNMPREDYNLRGEVADWLCKFNINEDILTFRDGIDLQALASLGSLNLFLVDHNVLPSSDDFLEPYVFSVLDHHVLERTDTPVHGMVVEPVGSCTTLIAEAFLKKKPSLLSCEIASFLHGTIIFDTVNLSETVKWATAKDKEMVATLESIAALSSNNRLNVFNQLTEAKKDITRLSTLQILRKDLKCIKGKNMFIALASLPLLVKEFVKRSDVEAALNKFVEARDVDLLVLLGFNIAEDIERDLAIFGYHKRMLEEVFSYLNSEKCSMLQLSLLDNSEIGNLRHFSQGNPTCSRKVILPLVKQWMNSSVCE